MRKNRATNWAAILRERRNADSLAHGPLLEREMEGLVSEKCSGCGKSFALLMTSGVFGDREPEGLLLNGVPYCFGCADEAARKIEEGANGGR